MIIIMIMRTHINMVVRSTLTSIYTPMPMNINTSTFTRIVMWRIKRITGMIMPATMVHTIMTIPLIMKNHMSIVINRRDRREAVLRPPQYRIKSGDFKKGLET
jgi:hypothetical protein